MTDYHGNVSILRTEMSQLIGSNAEQFAYVLSEALTDLNADDIIDMGSLSEDSEPELVIHNLRNLADAIESGLLS